MYIENENKPVGGDEGITRQAPVVPASGNSDPQASSVDPRASGSGDVEEVALGLRSQSGDAKRFLNLSCDLDGAE